MMVTAQGKIILLVEGFWADLATLQTALVIVILQVGQAHWKCFEFIYTTSVLLLSLSG